MRLFFYFRNPAFDYFECKQGIAFFGRGGCARMIFHPGAGGLRRVRFRTLGCYALTGAVESDADSLERIVLEMLTARTSERSGRLIDHDEAGSMEKKKREGYF